MSRSQIEVTQPTEEQDCANIINVFSAPTSTICPMPFGAVWTTTIGPGLWPEADNKGDARLVVPLPSLFMQASPA